MSTAPRPVRRPRAVAAPAGTLTLITDDLSLVVPPSASTMEGFREWATSDDFPERLRVTFLNGEIILDMSNEEINAHVAVKTEVGRVLSGLVRDQRLGKFFGDGVLLTNVAAGVSNNPDSLFVSRETLESARARFLPRPGTGHLYRELEGSPDWVLEVLSDSSVQKDTVRLRDAYHRAGIAEYWLVDARGDSIAFQILLRRKSGYAAATVKDGWQRSKVLARSFKLERILDDFGMWEYTLHVRDE